MDLFHKLIELVDKNSSMIPDGDYLELCDTIKQLRDKVKPPSFLIDQSRPMWMHDETSQIPPTYEPTVTARTAPCTATAGHRPFRLFLCHACHQLLT